MIVFDTDVTVLILTGSQDHIERAQGLADQRHTITIVTVEELVRGRLNGIRQAESGKSKVALHVAYQRFQQIVEDVQTMDVLNFSSAAEALVQTWKQQRIRVGAKDLRIAATCVSIGATLVTRNRRDFEQIPSLSVEFWN